MIVLLPPSETKRTPGCRKALGLSAAQDAEIERNAALRRAPTLPAICAPVGRADRMLALS